MKHANAYRIVSRVAIPALAVPLLFSFSSLSKTPATDLHDELTPMSSDALASVEDLASTGLAERILQSSGAIEADVETLRALLGDPNNGVAPGPLDSGRREINWDGVPASVTNVPNFPLDFFLVNSPRGLGYNAIDPGLEVSDQRFADINPTYAAEFTPFSGQKLFSPIGSNVSAVTFLLPGPVLGAKTPVRGFGVVFSDVDVAGSTGIILLGVDGRKLGRILAPVRSDARGSSFVGAVFRDAVIEGAILISGNGALSPTEKDISQGGRLDLVVMDDFIYGEPGASH